MKKTIGALVILFSLFMIGCTGDVGMTVNVTWEDNDYFTETGDWYLAAAVGSYLVDNTVAEDAFDQEAITAGENVTISFSYSGDSDMYTAFVYLDANGNGSFDADSEYITGYADEWIDTGDDTTFEVTPYY